MKDSSKKIIIAISIIAIIAIIVGICIFAFKPQAKDNNNSNAENTNVVEKNMHRFLRCVCSFQDPDI